MPVCADGLEPFTLGSGASVCARVTAPKELTKPKRFRRGEWLAFRDVELPKSVDCSCSMGPADVPPWCHCRSWMKIASREVQIALTSYRCRKRHYRSSAIECDLPPGHYDVVLGTIKDHGFRWVFLADVEAMPSRPAAQ